MGETSSTSKLLEVFYADENDGKNYYNAIVATSFVLFNINAILILPKIAPQSAKKTPEQLWKWRNIANSLIHSFLSGAGALLNLIKTPELRHDYIASYNLLSFSTLSFSVGEKLSDVYLMACSDVLKSAVKYFVKLYVREIGKSVEYLVGMLYATLQVFCWVLSYSLLKHLGYFIYDFIDMATHHRRTSTYELLVHHTLVVICYCLALVTKFYQGYALVSLLIEINSTFLHIRQLLIIQGWKKTNVFYRINSYFNIGTFIVFRLMNLVWMMCWLVLNQGGLNVGAATVTYTAFAQMFFLVHSLKLLKKILIADGFMNGKSLKDDSESTPEGSRTSVSDM